MATKWFICSQVDQTATQTRDINFVRGKENDTASINNNIIVGLPDDTDMLQGETIRTATLSLQAGDDYAGPAIYVAEFLVEPT